MLALPNWLGLRNRNYALAGPGWRNWHFFGEEKRPLSSDSPRCHLERRDQEEEKEKAVFCRFLTSLEKKLSCRHQGKGPRLYTAAEAESKGLVERSPGLWATATWVEKRPLNIIWTDRGYNMGLGLLMAAFASLYGLRAKALDPPLNPPTVRLSVLLSLKTTEAPTCRFRAYWPIIQIDLFRLRKHRVLTPSKVILNCFSPFLSVFPLPYLFFPLPLPVLKASGRGDAEHSLPHLSCLPTMLIKMEDLISNLSLETSLVEMGNVFRCLD
ncbi:hypothetical protein Tco_0660184 [Tanacetum coccineum]